MQTKLIAKSTATGLYFNGRAFEENDTEKALALRPGTTAQDFALAWGGVVVVEERRDWSASPAVIAPDHYAKAREFVVRAQRDRGQKSFAVRMQDGKEYSRRVQVDSPRSGGCAWVNWKGDKIALALIGGELRGDR